MQAIKKQDTIPPPKKKINTLHLVFEGLTEVKIKWFYSPCGTNVKALVYIKKINDGQY